jgi:hypothetical protein
MNNNINMRFTQPVVIAGFATLAAAIGVILYTPQSSNG